MQETISTPLETSLACSFSSLTRDQVVDRFPLLAFSQWDESALTFYRFDELGTLLIIEREKALELHTELVQGVHLAHVKQRFQAFARFLKVRYPGKSMIITPVSNSDHRSRHAASAIGFTRSLTRGPAWIIYEYAI